MNIKQLIQNTSDIVNLRDIIDHGSIKCLFDEQVVREIATCEGINESKVGVDTIGDSDLSLKLFSLIDYPDPILEVDIDILKKLEELIYENSCIYDYLETEEENELKKIEKIIDIAEEMVSCV